MSTESSTIITDLDLLEKITQIPQLAQNCADPALEVESTRKLRKLLSIERNPPIAQVINSGVVPKLIEFLSRNEKPDLVFESLWCLTNIASGTSDDAKVVVNGG